MIRPGGLTLDTPRGVGAIELNQGDTKSGRLARADVAALCVESLYYPDLTGETTHLNVTMRILVLLWRLLD